MIALLVFLFLRWIDFDDNFDNGMLGVLIGATATLVAGWFGAHYSARMAQEQKDIATVEAVQLQLVSVFAQFEAICCNLERGMATADSNWDSCVRMVAVRNKEPLVTINVDHLVAVSKILNRKDRLALIDLLLNYETFIDAYNSFLERRVLVFSKHGVPSAVIGQLDLSVQVLDGEKFKAECLFLSVEVKGLHDLASKHRDDLLQLLINVIREAEKRGINLGLLARKVDIQNKANRSSDH